ncbi:MAG: hypothetical protein Q8R02_16685 [Hyphomonadaceae bacterium]|nr:hypothetical protein [Hyphomonadaceae bacterium]
MREPNIRDYSAILNDPTMSSTAAESSTGKAGGGGSRQSRETEGAALSDLSAEARRAQAEAERGIAEMSAKFAEVGKELYVSETGKKREAID